MVEENKRHQEGQDYQCPYCQNTYNHFNINRCPKCGLYHRYYSKINYQAEPEGIMYKNQGSDNCFQCGYCGFSYNSKLYSHCPKCGVFLSACCQVPCCSPVKEETCCESFVFSCSHVHCYQGETSESFDHYHLYQNLTGKPVKVTSDGQHIHIIFGQTSLDDEHVHFYEECTGPAIPVPGGHIHCYHHLTFAWNGHCHEVGGETQLDEEWDKDYKFHKKKKSKA